MNDSSQTTTATPRGRYAPSPTGLLHVGNARTALVGWLSIRARGGTFVWRTEDLDPPRIAPGAAEAAMQDLRWLGLDWDEGPDLGGPHGPYRQSERVSLYESALRALHDAGRLFPCTLSRRELAGISSAPHGEEETEPPYPIAARPILLEDGWYDDLLVAKQPSAALRFRSTREPAHFVDGIHGPTTQETVGDFVLKRRDGLYAYQLAVVVDDWRMKITEVIRGDDLLASTGRQLELFDALGAPRPAFAHIPMVLDHQGQKLSKRDAGLTLKALRERGVTSEQLVGSLGWSLGLLDRPRAVTARDLVEGFRMNRIGRDDWRLPSDWADQLREIR